MVGGGGGGGAEFLFDGCECFALGVGYGKEGIETERGLLADGVGVC